MSLTEAFELYRLNCIAFKGQSMKTEESHMVTLRSIKNCLGDIEIEELTFVMVRDWKAGLLKTCAPSTVRGYVIKLRVVLAYLYKSGYSVLNPEVIPVPQRADKVPSYIDRHQVSLLIDNSRRLRSKAVISLLYASGIRVSELINLDRNAIKDQAFSVVGKGGKARLCFIDQRTDDYLQAYLETRTDKHPALFISSQTQGRMTATNVQLIVNIARNNSGITEKVTPHTLRHSYATDLLRNGLHIYTLSRLMGHASIQTTQIYLHVTDRDLKSDYSKFHTV